MTESSVKLHFAGRPIERSSELIAYAVEHRILIDDAIIDIVNRALQPPQAAAAPGYTPGDQLAPIRDAMARYEDALRNRQHGGVAAGAFIEEVYAVLNPNSPQLPEAIVIAAAEQPAEWSDGEGWLPDDETTPASAEEPVPTEGSEQ